jgi:hypothetical protein
MAATPDSNDTSGGEPGRPFCHVVGRLRPQGARGATRGGAAMICALVGADVGWRFP